tara:strand:- start:2054 stop:2239 length:186 start_codon:yes stop_codon:yes gene_type:complete
MDSMKVYTKITMSQGVLDTVDVSLERPKILDTSDEHWDNGFKVFEHEVDLEDFVYGALERT